MLQQDASDVFIIKKKYNNKEKEKSKKGPFYDKKFKARYNEINNYLLYSLLYKFDKYKKKKGFFKKKDWHQKVSLNLLFEFTF